MIVDVDAAVKLAREWNDLEYGPAWTDAQKHALILARAVLALHKSLAAAVREADRLRHGVPVEGDYVCPSDLERDTLRAALTEALDGWEEADSCATGGKYDVRIAELMLLL